MENRINELIFEILKIKTYTRNETKTFKKLKHNNQLVTTFKSNFESLVRLMGSYYNDCYDIQGVNDDGVDVLLKYRSEDDEHKVGFQIKSYDDIQDKNWHKTLKSQLFEAQGIWQLDDLYVVFCTDAIEHENKLRNSICEIQKYSAGKIHVIEPEEALTFYNFNSIDIISIIYKFYHKFDSQLEKAKKCLKWLSNKEKEILIHIIVYQFLNNESIYLQDLDDIPDSMDICSFSDSSLYNYDDDTNSISYCYENNWDLTNFVIEIKANFNLTDLQIEDFLRKILL
ncbi:MAG: hypothetical protein K2N58_08690 [Treponemataceae bacterium]|nr:hypothetical protein [Treponemataceae bacterium]